MGEGERLQHTHNHTHTHAHCLPPLLVAAARAPTPTPPYTHTHVRVRTPSHDVILAFLFLVLSITQITPFPPYLMLSHIALLLWLCFHIFYTINEKMVQFVIIAQPPHHKKPIFWTWVAQNTTKLVQLRLDWGPVCKLNNDTGFPMEGCISKGTRARSSIAATSSTQRRQLPTLDTRSQVRTRITALLLHCLY